MKLLQTTIVLVILFFSFFSMRSQTPFNRSHSGVGGNNLTELLITPKGYLVASENNSNPHQLDLIGFDFEGHLVDTVSYSFNHVTAGIENCGKCLKEKNGSIFYGQMHVERADSAYVQFIRFDSDLNIKDTSRYFIGFPYSSLQIHALEFDTDSTFLVTGLAFRKKPPLLGKYDLLVAKFDTAFNLIWETIEPDSRPNEHLGYIGQDILVDCYGTAIISGYGKYSNSNVGLCARINPVNGQILWLKKYPGTISQGAMFTVDNQNGTFQFCQNEATARRSNGSVRYTRLRVGKIDTNGSIITYKDIGPPNQFVIQTDLIPTSDGNYYTSGFIFLNGYYNSFGLKFAPNGDSLWMRYYHYDDYQDHSQIDIFHETPDSGFVHAGYYADLFQSSSFVVSTWLLKTDKYGCDSSGCHKVDLFKAHVPGLLEVYPNPSNGSFRLQWTYGPPETFELTIQDITGKVIYKDNNVFLSELEYAVDLADNPPGIYFLNLTLEGKAVMSKKLVIE